jgi:hypothetical protein
MMIRVLFLISMLISSSALAETIPGYDVLGIAKYCKEFLAAPKLPAMSTLLNTFGDPLPCTEKRIQQGGLKVLQVDLIDATCWRNNKCPPGVPKPTNLKVIKQRSATVSDLCNKYPDLDCWVSPALEHDEKNEAVVIKMLTAAQEGCPKCKVINSPFSGAKPKGWPVEKHGTRTTAFSVSGDGASMFDADNLSSDGKLNGQPFEHRTSGEKQTYAWFNELNLRCTGEKTFTPPLKRTNKPTGALFKQAYLVMQPEQPKPAVVPAQCKQVVDIRSPEIHKPNAEAYCNGQPPDPRGNKPLLIIKKAGKRGDKLNILSPTGKQVGCYGYYGTFPESPGGHRWYVGSCSGQTPAALFEALGGEWSFVTLGGGKCVRVNVIRRQGTFR